MMIDTSLVQLLAAGAIGWCVGTAPALVLLRRLRTDPLTGLTSRAGLAAALRRARHGRSDVGLLLLDLDDFKDVNDTHGHLVGDRVLVETARRLRAAALPGECAVRLHGDEFALLLTSPTTEHVEERRTAIAAALSRPIVLTDLRLHATASVGAAVLPAGHAKLGTLLGAADAAMYRAKFRRHAAVGADRGRCHCPVQRGTHPAGAAEIDAAPAAVAAAEPFG